MTQEPYFLYVEDDPLSRTVMESVLTLKLGYSRLTIFEDGINFIKRLEALPATPDIIFLDIHMKPYSGFDLINMLRGHHRYQNLIVVALTASVMSEEVVQLKESGFNGVIAKPIDIKTFGERINRILSGAEIWDII